MSRWFRWYEGTTEDGKFRVVARMSRVTVRDVLALWAFILEDAAHLDHRGVCQRNEDFMAAILDFEEGEVERILQAMEEAKMISVGMGNITVCNWDKRQFESDADSTAADRQRRKRERDKSVSNEPVTRDIATTDTDTDTEKKDVEGAQARTKRGSRLPEGWEPTPDGTEFARKSGLDPVPTLAAFRDHWTAASGQTASKLDWDAAWRTWCRKAREYARGKPAAIQAARGAYSAPAADSEERRLLGYAQMIKARVSPGQNFTSADRFKMIRDGLITMEDCEKAGCAA